VGGSAHRKGQLRVVGSPSELHTKEPRTGGPPGGRRVRGSYFFLRNPLNTYLRALKPVCRPPGPIGTILATNSWNDCHSRIECLDSKSGIKNLLGFRACNFQHVSLASGRAVFSSCGADPSKAKKRLSSPIAWAPCSRLWVCALLLLC
jgi:hypothetical protein